MSTTQDAEFHQIAIDCLNLTQDDYQKKMAVWKKSPFVSLIGPPSAHIGKIGKILISNHLSRKGFEVILANGRGADRIVAGKRARIKTSTLWDAGIYKFQQIRNEEFDFVVCFGLSPLNVHCWVLSKNNFLKERKSGNITGQHLGKSGKETAWFKVDPQSPEEWTKQYGGTMKQAIEQISAITGSRPFNLST